MADNALAPKVPAFTENQDIKPKLKTKSRTGCVTCKSKRLKCDEQKPYCFNCQKKNIKCGGYATRFKWRSFNEGKETQGDGDNVCKSRRPSQREIKQENTEDTVQDAPALLLKEHMELASLSVVGKTTEDMKRENELMSKGINPDTHIEKKKLRRSYSSADLGREQLVASKRRSNSSSHQVTAPSIQSFRNEFNGLHGLHSLAESAVNELRARSPGIKPTLFAIPQSPAPHVEQNAKDFSSPREQDNSQPREWAFARMVSSPENDKESLADINLTPSLSALINHAFSRDESKSETEGVLGFNYPEAALSPLDLNFQPHPHDASMPLKQANLPVHVGDDVPDDSRAFLEEVNNQLMKHENFSPSIINGTSSVRLMNTSEQEQILFLFSKYTCGIMSIKSGVSENPWRNRYLPLAKRYSFFFNSIASMTLFHLAGNSHLQEQSKALRSKGFSYMKRCIVELAAGLSKMENSDAADNQLPADIALATCLNLAVSETWDTHTSSGIAHLKGAKSMIQKILNIIKQYSFSGRLGVKLEYSEEQMKKKLVLVRNDEWQKMKDIQSDANGKEMALYIPKKILLLFNEWIYFEVLSQMTSYSAQDDKGIDLIATITKITNAHQKQKDEKRISANNQNDESPTDSVNLLVSNSLSNDGQFTFFENLDSILQNNDYIDPLLGCAQSLFLVMGKVANLICKVRKAQEAGKQSRNSLKNISLALELKKQLLDWKPNVVGNVEEMMEEHSGDSSWDIYSCVLTAEAYRYATLLYLHEAVPEVPLMTSYQLAEKVFVSLASIPSNSNLYIIHIFPLLISSCEAESTEEREWCEARWNLLVQRLWIGNIDRAFEVVKEVWRRKDEYKREQRREKEAEECASKERDENASISTHLEEVIKNIHKGSSRDEKGITSRLHWSSVMREWGWEVLLA